MPLSRKVEKPKIRDMQLRRKPRYLKKAPERIILAAQKDKQILVPRKDRKAMIMFHELRRDGWLQFNRDDEYATVSKKAMTYAPKPKDHKRSQPLGFNVGNDAERKKTRFELNKLATDTHMKATTMLRQLARRQLIPVQIDVLKYLVEFARANGGLSDDDGAINYWLRAVDLTEV